MICYRYFIDMNKYKKIYLYYFYCGTFLNTSNIPIYYMYKSIYRITGSYSCPSNIFYLIIIAIFKEYKSIIKVLSKYYFFKI